MTSPPRLLRLPLEFFDVLALLDSALLILSRLVHGSYPGVAHPLSPQITHALGAFLGSLLLLLLIFLRLFLHDATKLELVLLVLIAPLGELLVLPPQFVAHLGPRRLQILLGLHPILVIAQRVVLLNAVPLVRLRLEPRN